MKPWDPPEEHLYPILDDLLDDWWALAKPPFEGIRIIGLRWSPKSYDVKHFLARNGIPYQWLDIEASEEARHLVSYLESTSKKGSSGSPSTVPTIATTSSSFSILIMIKRIITITFHPLLVYHLHYLFVSVSPLCICHL